MSRGTTYCTYRYVHAYTGKMHLLLSLWLLPFLLALLIPAQCSSAENENSGRIGRAVGHSEQYIKQIFYAHANCTRTADWACDPECRLEFANRVTGLCVRPSPNEVCFGRPIRYNFTLEATDVISVLPKYELLSRFPRCWSALGPLLCAVAYRPCSNRTYFEVSMDEPGKMELWQVFRKDMCHRAMEMCGFLLHNGLWPEFVNCSDTVDQKYGRRIFSDGSCKKDYNKQPSVMEPKQCLWPMVDGSGHIKPMSRPLIDDCYLPCRSPLISSQWLYDGFKMLIFCFSLFVVIIGIICTAYLFAFSLLFINDLCVYSFTHALLNATAHWFIWLLSYFDRLAERAMCFNKLRRDEMIVRGLLDWCTLQSWILQTTILSGFFWLLIVITIQISQPKKLNSDQTVNLSKNCRINLRCFSLISYLFAGFIAAIGLWTNMVETDGIIGVCYLGLRTYASAVQLYCPLLLAFMLSLLTVVYLHRSNKGSLISKIRCKDRKELGAAEETNQLALIEERTDDVRTFGSSVNRGTVRRNGYSPMRPFWLGLICCVTALSLIAAVVVHSGLLGSSASERELILDSVRCSLNRTISDGYLGWLHETVFEHQQIDVFSRRTAIGNSFLSASGCELPSIMDDRLLPIFLVYLFFPSLPFLSVMLYLLAGFCGYGLIDVEKIRNKLNPFVLVKYPDVTITDDRLEKMEQMLISNASNVLPNKTNLSGGTSIEMQENIKQADGTSNELEDESRDTFISDPEIRRLDVIQRSRERRRRQQMENGFLGISRAANMAEMAGQPYGSPVWPNLQKDMRNAYYSLTISNGNGNGENSQNGTILQQTTTVLSAYQNGLIEGHWRERCSNYEKQIKVLSANLRLADHEIRRLAGLDVSKPETATTAAAAAAVSAKIGKPVSGTNASLVGVNYLPVTNVVGQDPMNSAAQSGRYPRPRDTKKSSTDNRNRACASRIENTEFLENPGISGNSRNAVKSEPCADDEKNDEIDEIRGQQASSLRPQCLFGRNAPGNPLSSTSGEGGNEHVSGDYCSDSDSFNSDEEDSEEERLYNEKVAELKRRQQ